MLLIIVRLAKVDRSRSPKARQEERHKGLPSCKNQSLFLDKGDRGLSQLQVTVFQDRVRESIRQCTKGKQFSTPTVTNTNHTNMDLIVRDSNRGRSPQ